MSKESSLPKLDLPVGCHGDFCRNIKLLRKQKRLTQQTMARMLCTDRSHISDYERGRNANGLAVLDRFAEALDTTPAFLVTPSEQNFPPKDATHAS